MICDTTYFLGCIRSCFTFDTGLIAPADGLTLRYKWLGTYHDVDLDATAGAPIVIPAETFNESAEQEFSIYDGNTLLSFDFDGILYESFKINTAADCCTNTIVI